MKYLADSCQDGRYGSTQSTVLALRAIVAYDRAHARPKAPGTLRLAFRMLLGDHPFQTAARANRQAATARIRRAARALSEWRHSRTSA